MRYIARLDLKSDYLIKSIRYEGLRNLGKPEKYAKKYFESGITEILLIDNVASLYRRDPSYDIIKKVSDNILVPLIFCGGLRTLKNVEKVFEAYMSPGSVTEILYFFVAKYDKSMKISEGGGLAEEQENIEVLELNFQTAYDMIKTGEIKDGKTIMLLQYAMIHQLL